MKKYLQQFFPPRHKQNLECKSFPSLPHALASNLIICFLIPECTLDNFLVF